MNSKLKQQPLYFQIIMIGGFIFIAFTLFALGSSIYRDTFQVGSFIDDAVSTIEEQQDRLKRMPSELVYAQSPQYQEKIAKELLGLRRPGETVLVLTSERQNLDDLLPERPERRTSREVLTNSQKWWRYLFGI